MWPELLQEVSESQTQVFSFTTILVMQLMNISHRQHFKRNHNGTASAPHWRSVDMTEIAAVMDISLIVILCAILGPHRALIKSSTFPIESCCTTGF